METIECLLGRIFQVFRTFFWKALQQIRLKCSRPPTLPQSCSLFYSLVVLWRNADGLPVEDVLRHVLRELATGTNNGADNLYWIWEFRWRMILIYSGKGLGGLRSSQDLIRSYYIWFRWGLDGLWSSLDLIGLFLWGQIGIRSALDLLRWFWRGQVGIRSSLNLLWWFWWVKVGIRSSLDLLWWFWWGQVGIQSSLDLCPRPTPMVLIKTSWSENIPRSNGVVDSMVRSWIWLPLTLCPLV